MSPLLISLAIIVALLWIYRHKWIDRVPKGFSGPPPHQPSQHFQEYDAASDRHNERKEVDRILEKIAARGMASLTAKERLLLDNAAKREKRHP